MGWGAGRAFETGKEGFPRGRVVQLVTAVGNRAGPVAGDVDVTGAPWDPRERLGCQAGTGLCSGKGPPGSGQVSQAPATSTLFLLTVTRAQHLYAPNTPPHGTSMMCPWGHRHYQVLRRTFNPRTKQEGPWGPPGWPLGYQWGWASALPHPQTEEESAPVPPRGDPNNCEEAQGALS